MRKPNKWVLVLLLTAIAISCITIVKVIDSDNSEINVDKGGSVKAESEPLINIETPHDTTK